MIKKAARIPVTNSEKLVWDTMCSEIEKNIEAGLLTTQDVGNPKFKFLMKILEKITKQKDLDGFLESMFDEKKAFKAELKMEGREPKIENHFIHKMVCPSLKKFTEQVNQSGPFLQERFNLINLSIASFLKGDICSEHEQLVNNYNKRIEELTKTKKPVVEPATEAVAS